MKNNNRLYIYFISLVSAMGGLLFGYDWVVIGGAKPFYEQFFTIAENPSMQGWAMSIALLGCLLGALYCGKGADQYGRKKLLLGASILFLVSAYLTGATSSLSMFLFARFLGGVGIGVASNLSPMYIAEIAPSQIRGRLVSLNQLTIVLGILGAQIMNMLIAESVPEDFTAAQIRDSWNGQFGWRWMFWVEAVPALLFFLLLFFIPESPRWLALKGKRENALKILESIYNKQEAQKELQTICQTSQSETEPRFKTLGNPLYRKVLIIGIVLAIFQQWCGTNVIFNYAQEIFQSAGFTLNDVMFNIVITGIANLIFTFIAIYSVDRWGRRALMIVGSLGLASIYLVMGLGYFFEIKGPIMVCLVVIAIGCYAMSLGPVTWVLLSEIFPNKIRSLAMATATFFLWIGCFTLTYSFPMLNSYLGSSGTFWIYSLICFAGFLFIFYMLPETKGYSLEELENKMCKSPQKEELLSDYCIENEIDNH